MVTPVFELLIKSLFSTLLWAIAHVSWCLSIDSEIVIPMHFIDG